MRGYIANKLLSLECEQNGDVFSKTTILTQPGAQMIINGHQVQQPPQQIPIKSTVELLENGYIENMDGSNHEIIYWINIKVQQGDNTVIDQTEGLYTNEQKIFDIICNQIFKSS